jgi:hypothetical protein
VTPYDDATWPVCLPHDSKRHWCDWTRGILLESKDRIEPGGRYCIPIVPLHELYGEVSVDVNELAPGMYALAVVTMTEDSDFSDVFGGGITENLVDLGIWQPGEGRLAIARVVKDWMEGEYSDQICYAPSHGFSQEMQFADMMKSTNEPSHRELNAWCLITYRMCWPCYVSTVRNGGDPSIAPIVDTTAGAYGLDDTVTAPRVGGSSAREQRTRDALANRQQQRHGLSTRRPF